MLGVAIDISEDREIFFLYIIGEFIIKFSICTIEQA